MKRELSPKTTIRVFSFLQVERPKERGRKNRVCKLRWVTAMKKLARKWRDSQDGNLSLPTRDDPTLDDSRPMDSQGLSLYFYFFFASMPLNFVSVRSSFLFLGSVL